MNRAVLAATVAVLAWLPSAAAGDETSLFEQLRVIDRRVEDAFDRDALPRLLAKESGRDEVIAWLVTAEALSVDAPWNEQRQRERARKIASFLFKPDTNAALLAAADRWGRSVGIAHCLLMCELPSAGPLAARSRRESTRLGRYVAEIAADAPKSAVTDFEVLFGALGMTAACTHHRAVELREGMYAASGGLETKELVERFLRRSSDPMLRDRFQPQLMRLFAEPRLFGAVPRTRTDARSDSAFESPADSAAFSALAIFCRQSSRSAARAALEMLLRRRTAPESASSPPNRWLVLGSSPELVPSDVDALLLASLALGCGAGNEGALNGSTESSIEFANAASNSDHDPRELHIGVRREPVVEWSGDVTYLKLKVSADSTSVTLDLPQAGLSLGYAVLAVRSSAEGIEVSPHTDIGFGDWRRLPLDAESLRVARVAMQSPDGVAEIEGYAVWNYIGTEYFTARSDER